MYRRLYLFALLLMLPALAACGGTPAATGPRSQAATTPSAATTTPTATPAPTPPAGFVFFISPDHTFQIAYPAEWQVVTLSGTPATFEFRGAGQVFDVSELGASPTGTPAEIDNAYCQQWQKGIAQNPVRTSSVTLAGQTWTRANCDAGVAGAAVVIIVEVVNYQGGFYQLAYTSPVVEFKKDNATYYSKMERSFQFLR
jgi:hypothetical protein